MPGGIEARRLLTQHRAGGDFAEQRQPALPFKDVQPRQQHQLALHQRQEVPDDRLDQRERRIGDQVLDGGVDAECVTPLAEAAVMQITASGDDALLQAGADDAASTTEWIEHGTVERFDF